MYIRDRTRANKTSVFVFYPTALLVSVLFQYCAYNMISVKSTGKRGDCSYKFMFNFFDFPETLCSNFATSDHYGWKPSQKICCKLQLNGSQWPCMMTSSNGNIFRVTGRLCGEFAGFHWRSDVSFDLCQNKRLSKQSWGRWFETPSCSLWRHCNDQSRSQLGIFGSMITSSNGNIFRVTGPLWEEFTGHRGPSQRPVTRGFDVLFDLRLNKRLGKPSRRWWFKTPSRSVWCHCNMDVTDIRICMLVSKNFKKSYITNFCDLTMEYTSKEQFKVFKWNDTYHTNNVRLCDWLI